MHGAKYDFTLLDRNNEVGVCMLLAVRVIPKTWKREGGCFPAIMAGCAVRKVVGAQKHRGGCMQAQAVGGVGSMIGTKKKEVGACKRRLDVGSLERYQKQDVATPRLPVRPRGPSSHPPHTCSHLVHTGWLGPGL